VILTPQSITLTAKWSWSTSRAIFRVNNFAGNPPTAKDKAVIDALWTSSHFICFEEDHQ